MPKYQVQVESGQLWKYHDLSTYSGDYRLVGDTRDPSCVVCFDTDGNRRTTSMDYLIKSAELIGGPGYTGPKELPDWALKLLEKVMCPRHNR